MNRFAVIASAALLSLAAASSAFAGKVTGRAVDEDGKPLAGVKVEIVYITFSADDLMTYEESIKSETETGADGTYVVDLSSMPPGEYYAHAYELVMNGGQPFNIDLVIDDETTFGGNVDTVRNFTAGIIEFSEKHPYGNAGVFVLNRAIEEDADLAGAEVRLENVENGKVIERVVRPSGEGLVVTGVPFGTYRASVKLDGAPLLVSMMGPGITTSYGPTVTHDFTMGWLGNQMQVQAKRF